MNTSSGSVSAIYADTDLLAWVGRGAYPTVDSFVREAHEQGCSRRLPGLLPWIRPGRTRVFLVHKDSYEDDALASIFGFYTINSTHVIFDDIECGRDMRIDACRPVLAEGLRPPADLAEFESYVTRRKIDIERRNASDEEPTGGLLGDLWKDWLKDAIKHALTDRGTRDLSWSNEADIFERLCGGASDLGSGRFPGAYASDDLGDWILDQLLDWLLDEPELPDEYFWEDVWEEGKPVRRRRKHERAAPGSSRSGRIDLGRLRERTGKPPADLLGLTLFKQPYPVYRHPVKAAFRGFQRIDGNSLLLKVNLPQYLLPDAPEITEQPALR